MSKSIANRTVKILCKSDKIKEAYDMLNFCKFQGNISWTVDMNLQMSGYKAIFTFS